MLRYIDSFLPTIYNSLGKDNDWDSLVINKRKPYTTRIFRQFDKLRVCFHRFEPCKAEETFAHPHPWPAAFLMLKGAYYHKIGYSLDLNSDPVFIYNELVNNSTAYEITHKQVWHSIQPITTSYTLMINGPAWDGHVKTRTTKGKDLDKLTSVGLSTAKEDFKFLLSEYMKLNGISHERETQAK